jgi:hypothetical protein
MINYKVIYTNYESNIQKKLCKIKTNELLKNIKNWSKNRPEDIVRVKEIKEKLKERLCIIGEIRIWKYKNNNYIYDGLHRYKASELLYNDENINLDLNIIIYETLNEQDIINEFIDINKSIAIPALYIDESLNVPYIQPIIRQYQEKYPSFAKSTRLPQKPNFNRDIIVDLICNILKNQADFTSQKLVEILEKINMIIKDDIINKNYYMKEPLKKCIEKCEKHNLYLFMYGNEYFRLLFEKHLNDQYN